MAAHFKKDGNENYDTWAENALQRALIDRGLPHTGNRRNKIQILQASDRVVDEQAAKALQLKVCLRDQQSVKSGLTDLCRRVSKHWLMRIHRNQTTVGTASERFFKEGLRFP